ncbi:MAG: hypothetical protein H6818_12830 [Phycisphaerales bacterium]|nr:hypothetical protein [Phycisphaerales bacterium]
MAIRVRCKCGKSLKIGAALADKKIACPGCKRPFRIPAAKFAAAERKAAEKAGRSPSAKPAVAPETPEPMSLDDEFAAMGSGLIDFSQSDVLEFAAEGLSAPSAPAAVPIDGFPEQVNYASGAAAGVEPPRRLADPISGPKRGFWADAFVSFIYPAQSVGNAITLGIIFVVSAIEALVAAVPGCFALLAVLVIKGWFASLYFSVIQETASGSEDLPGLDLEGGWVDGIFMPALKFVGAFAVVLLPFVGLSILAAAGDLPKFVTSLMPLWFLAGVFMAPMSFLLFALGSPGTLFRLHVVLPTIAKTILPYLAIWLMLSLIFLVMMVVSLGGAVLLTALFPAGSLSPSISSFAATTFGSISISMFGTYLMIVAMRMIGLYYLHFKKRFVFVME